MRHKCDICSSNALYDAKTKFGPWAFLCSKCFKSMGGTLGLGKGQKLEVEETPPQDESRGDVQQNIALYEKEVISHEDFSTTKINSLDLEELVLKKYVPRDSLCMKTEESNV